MRDIRECSGLWKGQWVQGRVRGAMAMHLRFDGSRITGGGSDRNGSFTMNGSYDAETHAVFLRKQYSFLRIDYSGPWNGQFVAGPSAIYQVLHIQRGRFEIWPVEEEQEIGELEESAERVQETVVTR